MVLRVSRNCNYSPYGWAHVFLGWAKIAVNVEGFFVLGFFFFFLVVSGEGTMSLLFT